MSAKCLAPVAPKLFLASFNTTSPFISMSAGEIASIPWPRRSLPDRSSFSNLGKLTKHSVSKSQASLVSLFPPSFNSRISEKNFVTRWKNGRVAGASLLLLRSIFLVE